MIEITECRVCGGSLSPVLDLGIQSQTGHFPKPGEEETYGPLILVVCDVCQLIQLKHTYDLEAMYGDGYGYRSGLNKAMVKHLTEIAGGLDKYLKDGDTVLDIGSNDGTLLGAFKKDVWKVGMDPTAAKFREFYPAGAEICPTFFSATHYRRSWRHPAKVITSIAMFYDLEDPVGFAKDVFEILDDDGVWFLEQSYFPNAQYDMINHEHLEYYTLRSLADIMERARFGIIDVKFNDTNGGSIAITVKKHARNCSTARRIMERERVDLGLFARMAEEHRLALHYQITRLNREGKTVYGYGASTKGNAVLQWCGFTKEDIPCIVEVNPDKDGCVTPGTHIPIVMESEAVPPDYYLVLPWHFREGILENNKEYREAGGKFIFPFPEIEIV